MKHQIPLFKFTLGHGQSIGPAALQAMWVRACQSANVSVGRHPGALAQDKPTYALYAAQNLPDLPGVEARLRRLLEAQNLRVSLVAMPA